MIKPFLILQLRPEDEASDDEFAAFLRCGGLSEADVYRVRIEKESIPHINLDDYSGVIIGGGPSNVCEKEETKSKTQKRFEKDIHKLLDDIVARDFPYLGACYGLGILAKYLGGEVSKERYSEPVGAVPINLTKEAQKDPLIIGLPKSFRAFAGHKEACQDIPPGATLIATSPNCPVQMIRYKQNIYGAQFHPELDRKGLIVRINVYRHAGYFPPEDADMLIAAAHKEDIMVPRMIFERFITKYSQPE